MKKTNSDSDSSAKYQSIDPEMPSSVVTQLRGNNSKPTPQEPEIDLPEIDLEALRAAIDELPELNATKLVGVHRRISNGDYKIDSQALATKLIELESLLDAD